MLARGHRPTGSESCRATGPLTEVQHNHKDCSFEDLGFSEGQRTFWQAPFNCLEESRDTASCDTFPGSPLTKR